MQKKEVRKVFMDEVIIINMFVSQFNGEPELHTPPILIMGKAYSVYRLKVTKELPVCVCVSSFTPTVCLICVLNYVFYSLDF